MKFEPQSPMESEVLEPLAEVAQGEVAGLLHGSRSPVGWAVTPRTCTCRVATSITNRT